MDPLLVIDGVAVGVAALLAYVTAIAKKVLKARLVKLEKARDILFQRYILVHRHLKAIDGTRKLYVGWVVEKRKKLDELTLELEELEQQTEEEGEGEVRTETEGTETGGEEGMEPTEGEPAVEEGSSGEEDAGDERQEATEEERPGGTGGDPEKPDADLEEDGEEGEEKDIKVNFLNKRRAIDFSREQLDP